MSSPVTLDDADFGIDFDAPPGYRSANDKSHFQLWFAVIAGVVFLLQIILPQVVMMFFAPTMTMFGGGMTIQVPHVDRAFRWKDELWVPFEQVQPGRPAQHVLRTFAEGGDWAKDRDIAVTIDAKHFVSDGDRLWMVSDGAVGLLQNGQATTLYPRRRLSQPSNAFLYQGALCVLDRAPNGAYRWLTFREGEWTDRAGLIAPSVVTAAPGASPPAPVGVPPTPPLPPLAWQFEKLQVVEQEGQMRLFLSSSNQLWTATVTALPEAAPETVAVPDVDGPASADQLANVDPQLLDLEWTSLGPLAASDWRVVPIAGRLAVVSRIAAPFKMEIEADWLDELDGQPFAETNAISFENFQVVAGDDEATVFVDTFPPGGCRQIPLTAAGFGTPKGGAGGMFDMFGMLGKSYWTGAIIGNLIPLALMIGLVLAGHVLMARHRDLRYCFGHDTVRLGSLGRRSVARIIDTIIYSTPFYATVGWIWFVYGFDFQKLVDAFMADVRRGITMVLVGVLGLLAYGLLTVIVMGTLEGWYGWSPGKLLCGLRVVRTNFQKCGALRGVLRQILLIVDGFFNYLVGIALIGLLPKCQRVGDLVSDTIVVEADSLRIEGRERGREGEGE